MRILALTTRSPFPLHEGRALRTYNLLKEIARRHEVLLCTFVQSRQELDGLPQMRAICADVYAEPLYLEHPRRELLKDVAADVCSVRPILATKYRRRSMMRRMGTWLRERSVDLVHLDMLHLGEFVPVAAGLPTVLVEHNLESAILARRLQTERNPFVRAYLRYQHVKLRHYEARLCSKVDEVVTVSDLDATRLRALCPAGSFTTVPNGVDAQYFETRGRSKRPGALVYVGGLGWFPNLDAIRYFTAQILPRIAASVPEVSLTVVGALPNPRIVAEFARFPNVTLTGSVDDVRPFIDEAAAYVVPLRIGGGTRLKILDALAMSKALISTPVGCEGLELEPRRHLLVAESPTDFAAQVVQVLRDPGLARRLGEEGGRCVRARYAWESIAQVLEQVYSRALAKGRAAKDGKAPCVV